MKGYIIRTNRWEEIVNESQLIAFANDSNNKKNDVSSAIISLKNDGIEVEEVTLYGKREIL